MDNNDEVSKKENISPENDAKHETKDEIKDESKDSKEYYDDLYNNGWPKEVVQLLMQTHPFKNKPEEEDVAYEETIKAARREEIGRRIREMAPELEESRKQESQKADERQPKPEKNRPKEDRASSKYRKEREASDEDEEEPEKKFSRRRQRHVYEEGEDIDIEKGKRQSELDDLFNKDKERRYITDIKKQKSANKLAAVVIVIILFGLGALTFAVVYLNNQLKVATEKVATFDELQAKNEEYKLQILSLEEEIETLTAQEEEPEETPSPEETATSPQTDGGLTTIPAGGTKYKVQSGDTFWSISEDFYGNGVYFEKILTANGLKESDTLREGQELIIPPK